MTFPLPLNAMTTSGDGIISQRPALAAKAMEVIALWAVFECNLMGFYAYMMGAYLPQIAGMAAPINPVALQIFTEIENFRMKRELFEALLRWHLSRKGCWFLVYKGLVTTPIKNAAKSRHRMAHTVWGICPDYPDALIEQLVFGRSLVWRLQDFDVELAKVRKAVSALGKFEAKVRKLAGRRFGPVPDGASN
jgi:hypothetical protein